jgi:hypothetical protein
MMKKRNLVMAMTAAMAMNGAAQAEPTIEIGGVIEVEAVSAESSSDIAVATAELGINAQITDKVSAALVLLHEEDDTPFGVDAATITLNATEALAVTAGQTVVPFGLFESNMISDPLALELAETPATALQLDYTAGPISASLYTFNGGNASDEEIDNHGASIRYSSETFTLGAGYIANLGDSDLIAAETLNSEVAATSINIGVNLGNFALLAEHISASDKFHIGDGNADFAFNAEAQPSATQVEACRRAAPWRPSPMS